MENIKKEIQVTGCHNCPCINGEFDFCQIDRTDTSKTHHGDLPKKCPLKKAEFTIKLKS